MRRKPEPVGTVGAVGMGFDAEERLCSLRERGANRANCANRSKKHLCMNEPEVDPCPGVPYPQPGDTLLPGWGTRVSMEYRLWIASEDECLEWAKELWQLELVAKARNYPKKWAAQIARNRVVWREAFAVRDKTKAPDVDGLDEVGGV